MEEKKDLITDDVIFLFFKYLQKNNDIQLIINIEEGYYTITSSFPRLFNCLNKIINFINNNQPKPTQYTLTSKIFPESLKLKYENYNFIILEDNKRDYSVQKKQIMSPYKIEFCGEGGNIDLGNSKSVKFYYKNNKLKEYFS